DQFLQAQEPAWPESPRSLPLQKEIRFEGVSFAYNERSQHAALRDVNLVIAAGQTTAFCGPSGAGESNLGDILMGLLQPSSGRVLIDNMPLAGENVHHWRRSSVTFPRNLFCLTKQCARTCFGPNHPQRKKTCALLCALQRPRSSWITCHRDS